MAENVKLPPIPEGRPAKYKWIAQVHALGFRVKAACAMCGVPEVSYYKANRKAKEKNNEQG